MIGTKEMSDQVNYQLCKQFGVDKFSSLMMVEGKPSVIRTETHYFKVFFFFEFCSEHVKHFYPWKFSWTVGKENWWVILEPIVKKTIKGKDISYDLDEQAMRKTVHKLIKLKKRIKQ